MEPVFGSRPPAARLLVALLIACWSASAGCADHPSVGRSSAAILDPDYTDDTPPFDFPQVVQVGFGCTGTLIAPSTVLTAAHCVARATPFSVRFEARAADTQVDEVAVANCWMHPQFAAQLGELLPPELRGQDLGERCGVAVRPGSFQSSSMSRVDFAILQLERPIPHLGASLSQAGAGRFSITALPIATEATLPASGEQFDAVAVGYASNRRDVKRSRRTMHPALIQANDLMEGDSGGPLLFETSSGFEVVGVASTQGEWASIGRPEIGAWIRLHIDRDRDGWPDTYCLRGARDSHPDANGSNDTDGDWVLDSIDTCPATYNPCQEGTDLDGDGTDDDCDACPLDPERATRRGDPSLTDADDDLVPDVCDCQPDAADAWDIDGDFVMGSCDNCPRAPNPLQEDCDGDRQGNACEVVQIDADGDRVDDRCMDNCVGVPNADQSNCNADAERWAGLEPLGDACDPVPCGDTMLETTRGGGFAGTRVRRDRVLVDARSTVTQQARTGIRFCACKFASGGDTFAARDICASSGAGCRVDDPDEYYADEANLGWRRATVSWARRIGTVGDEAVATYSSPPTDGSFEIDLEGTWRLRDHDEPRWEATFLEEPGLDRPGVVWTHTAGRPDGGPLEVAPGLASHFWSGVIERDRPDFTAFPRDLRVAALPRFPRECWVCEGHFPEAFLGIDPATGQPLIATALGAVDATPTLGPSIRSLDLASTERWVNPGESADQLTGTSVRMVAIDRAEGRVAHVIIEQAGRFERRDLPHSRTADGGPPTSVQRSAQPLMLAQEAPVEVIAIVDRIAANDPPRRERQVTQRTALAAPTSDERETVAAVSARLERLWVFSPAGQLTITDLRTGHSSEIGYPAPVLAATYSAALGSLMVLDVDDAVARLVRVSPDGKFGEVLGKWARTGATTRFALASASSGWLWLVASDDTDKHTIAWLDLTKESIEARVVQQHDWPIEPGVASASAMGLSIVVLGPGGPQPVGYRASELKSTTLEIDACF